jgi:hypothetical protein
MQSQKSKMKVKVKQMRHWLVDKSRGKGRRRSLASEDNLAEGVIRLSNDDPSGKKDGKDDRSFASLPEELKVLADSKLDLEKNTSTDPTLATTDASFYTSRFDDSPQKTESCKSTPETSVSREENKLPDPDRTFGCSPASSFGESIDDESMESRDESYFSEPRGDDITVGVSNKCSSKPRKMYKEAKNFGKKTKTARTLDFVSNDDAVIQLALLPPSALKKGADASTPPQSKVIPSIIPAEFHPLIVAADSVATSQSLCNLSSPSIITIEELNIPLSGSETIAVSLSRGNPSSIAPAEVVPFLLPGNDATVSHLSRVDRSKAPAGLISLVCDSETITPCPAQHSPSIAAPGLLNSIVEVSEATSSCLSGDNPSTAPRELESLVSGSEPTTSYLKQGSPSIATHGELDSLVKANEATTSSPSKDDPLLEPGELEAQRGDGDKYPIGKSFNNPGIPRRKKIDPKNLAFLNPKEHLSLSSPFSNNSTSETRSSLVKGIETFGGSQKSLVHLRKEQLEKVWTVNHEVGTATKMIDWGAYKTGQINKKIGFEI